ncbi:MAG TPA: cyclic nucleotide-binding domain-containing protein [Myxococcaceae bacterium]|nr:cyclic nucleotide-binding domain-containing protein [Myxococcaceae bacterium]
MDPAELKADASKALAAGDFARAATLYASYCSAAPNDRQSLLRMGDACARAGDKPRAVDAYLAAAQGFAADGFLARAIAASKLVLELEPGHQRMQRILADLYAQRGVGPGVGRRAREAPPQSSPAVAAGAPATAPASATPGPNGPRLAARAEDGPELVVTEFVLDTPSSERTLEEALAEAVTSRPAAPPLVDAPSSAPAPGPPAAQGPAPAEEPPRERFAELSLEDAELRLPEAAAPPPPPPPPPPPAPLFTLAEPAARAAPVPAAPAEPPATETPAEAPAEAARSAEDARYIDLSFEEDEPLEGTMPEGTPPAAAAPAADEPLAPEAPSTVDATSRSVPKAPLFSDLSSEAFVELVERCPLRHFMSGERIIQQDAPGDAFYVICEGRVAVRREEGGEVYLLAHLSEGDFFGEMALLSGAPRVASVDAVADGTLVLEISTTLLTELTRRHPGVAAALKKFCRQRLVANLMATSALFRPLSRADRRALASGFRARDVLAGDVVLTEGERGDGLYLVLAGQLEVSRGGFRIAKLAQGEVFGEASLLGRRPALATVRAVQRTSLLRLPEEDFARVAERYPAVRAHLEALRDARARENARLPLDPGEEAALLV